MLRPFRQRVRRHKNILDNLGTVRLSAALIDKTNRAIKGNITKSWRFPNTRVSAVMLRVERMFEDEANAFREQLHKTLERS